MKSEPPVRIGLFGVGLETYWDQFAGLKDRLEGYQNRIAGRMESSPAQVLNAGLVDQPQKARAAAEFFSKGGLDLVFIYISTYALSSTVLPVVQNLGVPVVVLNLQPEAQLDYEAFNRLGDRGAMTGKWLEYCQAVRLRRSLRYFTAPGFHFTW